MAMFRLDYLSCLLTVLATILVGRKMWTGLVVSGLNSLIVCVIGFHTSQYGFIPANVFCICINAFSLRAWLKAQKDRPASDTDTSSGLLTGGKRMSAFKLLKQSTSRAGGFLSRHGDSEVVSAGDGQHLQLSAGNAQFLLGSASTSLHTVRSPPISLRLLNLMDGREVCV